MTMTILITVVALVLTGLAFWKKEPVLYLFGALGWLIITFFWANAEYPVGNDYLVFAAVGLCLSGTLIMSIQTIRTFFTDKIGREMGSTPGSASDMARAVRTDIFGRPRETERQRSKRVQDGHKKIVADLTRRKPRKSWLDDDFA